MKNAFAVTTAAAKQSGSTRVSAPRGAVAFYTKDHPTSVYLGSGQDVDGDCEGDAERRVGSGPDRLRRQAPGLGVLGRPRAAREDEVTETSDGRVYIRYLAPSASAGTKTPYLTVGTYPVKNALDTTKAAASGGDTKTLDVGDGGFAFYSTSSPTNVHLAYQDSDYQIEVYDPSAERAHDLVTSGRVTEVK